MEFLIIVAMVVVFIIGAIGLMAFLAGLYGLELGPLVLGGITMIACAFAWQWLYPMANGGAG